MAYDSTVAYCDRCDQLTAADGIATCDFDMCLEKHCPNCKVISRSDPHLGFCSHLCAGRFDKQQNGESAK